MAHSLAMCRRYAWVFAVMAILGPVIGLVISGVVTYVMPKMYESETVIEVKPSDCQNKGISGSSNMTPQFFATEFEIIKNRKCMEQVIDALKLTTRWSVDQETAIQILKRIVKSQNIRGTDLISIRVRHTNKVDARDIVNEVAHAYKDYRNGIEKRDAGSIELRIPYESVVIHDEAVIPEVPVSPNVTLNLVLGTVGGFLLSPLMSLLVIGVMRLVAKPVVAR